MYMSRENQLFIFFSSFFLSDNAIGYWRDYEHNAQAQKPEGYHNMSYACDYVHCEPDTISSGSAYRSDSRFSTCKYKKGRPKNYVHKPNHANVISKAMLEWNTGKHDPVPM